MLQITKSFNLQPVVTVTIFVITTTGIVPPPERGEEGGEGKGGVAGSGCVCGGGSDTA